MDDRSINRIFDSITAASNSEAFQNAAKHICELFDDQIANVSKFIVNKGFEAETCQQPLIAKLLLYIKLVSQYDSCYSVDDAIACTIKKLPETKYELNAFDKRLKFINELLKMGLVNPSVFMYCARRFAATGDSDYFVPLIFEILQNYDMLVADKVIKEGFMDTCYCYLAAVFRLSAPVEDFRLQAIFSYVSFHSADHTHGQNCTFPPRFPPPKPLFNSDLLASLGATDDVMYRLLACCDELIDNNKWQCDGVTAKSVKGRCYFLQVLENMDISNGCDCAEETSLDMNGGWPRSGNDSLELNDSSLQDEVDPENESNLALDTGIISKANGSFDLHGKIDHEIEKLKQYFESIPSDDFSECIGLFLENLFFQLGNDSSLDAAVELCTGLSKVISSDGKHCFMTEFKYSAVKYFHKDYENGINNLMEVLAKFDYTKEQYDFIGISFRSKMVNIPQLIVKLFANKCISVSFLISFLNQLLETKNEENCKNVLEVLRDFGKVIEVQADLKDLSDDFDRTFLKLCDLRDNIVLRPMIEDVVFLKQNDWVALKPIQAVVKLKLLKQGIDRDPATVLSLMHINVEDCPVENCRHYYDIVVSKLQKVASAAVTETPPKQNKPIGLRPMSDIAKFFMSLV